MATDTAPARRRPQYRNIHVTDLLAYRLPAAGMVSIMHRISGALLFLLLPPLLWLFDLSLMSEIGFQRLVDLTASPLARLVLLAVIWAVLHHLVAGIRYLALDVHVGIDKQGSHRSALAVYAISLPLTLLAALRLFGVI